MATAEILSMMSEVKTFQDAPGADVTIGTVALVGGRVTIAYDDITSGEDGSFVYAAEQIEAPMAAVTIVAGEAAYWDDSAKLFTNVVGSNTLCGMFLEDAASGTATVRMELNQ